MDTATRLALAASFGRDTKNYAASRPAYPREAVSWMVGTDPCDVLDLGAGAGALTSVLLAAGHRVVAADPSAAMLDELGAHRPRACAVQCAAEALPFAPAGFDAVTVATAFHWFDASRALPEIARVLRSGGRLALTWNTRDESVPWVRRLGDLLRSVQPASLTADWGTGSVTRLRSCPLFDAIEQSEFAFAQLIDRDGLRALVVSRSYVQALAPPDRQRLLADVTTLFDETAAVTSAGDHRAHLWLPYRSQCWRATVTVRRSPGRD